MIVVCGEALIDVMRTQDGAERSTPGGGPFNTARGLARLGVPVAFLGHLSDDERGRELASVLTAEGVDLELAGRGPEPTTRAIGEIDREGRAHYRFEVEGTSAPKLPRSAVPKHLPERVTAVHAGSLGLVLEPIASTLLELLDRESGRRVVMIDPNVRTGLIPDADYRRRLQRTMAGSTIVKASDSDLQWIYPTVGYAEAARALVREGVALAVVTLGRAGAFAVHRGFEVTVAAPAVDVVDTIGAGDAFGAGLLAWLHDHDMLRRDLWLERAQLQAALRYACMAAAIKCSRAGAEPPWKREMTAPA